MLEMHSRPTLFLVPGAFAPTASYQSLALHLRAAGHDAYIIPTPSVGARPGSAPGLYDDAAAVTAYVEKFLDADADGEDGVGKKSREAVLIGHSYGGCVISQAAKGLSVREREARGKSGGVGRLVYVAALVPRVGERVVDLIHNEAWKSAKEKNDPYMTFSDIAAFAGVLLNDLPDHPSLQLALAAQLQEHSTQSYEDPLTEAGYNYVPSTYVLCTKDLLGPREVQEGYIQKLRDGAREGGVVKREGEEGGEAVDVVEIEAGHCPNLSMPGKLTELLLGVLNGV